MKTFSRNAPSAAGRPTILDVARRARVSMATVSRVLNQSAPVSERAKRDVQRAAAHLGFRPNLLGRNLRASRTRALGVVLPTLTHPVFAECLQGLEAAAVAGRHALMLTTTGYDATHEDGAVERLLRHRVDGLILTVADAARSRVLDKLDREAVPYVLVYNQLGRRTAKARTTVSVDNCSAAREMVEHLIQLGHRRIAMVAGSFRQSDRARLRFRGYAEAMLGAGLDPLPALEVAFMATDAQAMLVDALSSGSAPTALFCSSDQLALLVIRDLHRLQRRVPTDVSVAGFDGVASLATPTLTTVVQPTLQIAAAAIECLLNRIGGRSDHPRALLPHAIRFGDSTAPMAPRSPKTPALTQRPKHRVSAPESRPTLT